MIKATDAANIAADAANKVTDAANNAAAAARKAAASKAASKSWSQIDTAEIVGKLTFASMAIYWMSRH